MKITTYLTLDGTTREAFTFYKDVLGGTLEMMTFAQAPDAEQFPAEYRERIMHACLNLGDGVLMASDSLPDTCGGGPYEGIKGCSVSLHPTSVDESEKLFAALAEGGTVIMPPSGRSVSACSPTASACRGWLTASRAEAFSPFTPGTIVVDSHLERQRLLL